MIQKRSAHYIYRSGRLEGQFRQILSIWMARHAQLYAIHWYVGTWANDGANFLSVLLKAFATLSHYTAHETGRQRLLRYFHSAPLQRGCIKGSRNEKTFIGSPAMSFWPRSRGLQIVHIHVKKRTLQPSKCRNLHYFRLCRKNLPAISALPTCKTSFIYCFLVSSGLTCSRWHHRIWIKTFCLALKKKLSQLQNGERSFVRVLCATSISIRTKFNVPYFGDVFFPWRKICVYTDNPCEGAFGLAKKRLKTWDVIFHPIRFKNSVIVQSNPL